MKKYTKELLVEQGYEIENAKIESVSLNMNDHACLTLNLHLDGGGWAVVFGGYVLGKGYLGAKEDFFKGYASGMEAIMLIMNTVGVSDLLDLKGKYVRVAKKRLCEPVKIIGNILEEKWFDYASFFEDKECEGDE